MIKVAGLFVRKVSPYWDTHTVTVHLHHIEEQTSSHTADQLLLSNKLLCHYHKQPLSACPGQHQPLGILGKKQVIIINQQNHQIQYRNRQRKPGNLVSFYNIHGKLDSPLQDTNYT